MDLESASEASPVHLLVSLSPTPPPGHMVIGDGSAEPCRDATPLGAHGRHMQYLWNKFFYSHFTDGGDEGSEEKSHIYETPVLRSYCTQVLLRGTRVVLRGVGKRLVLSHAHSTASLAAKKGTMTCALLA